MNLQNEETNLPLFKYTPEITSQLLIQTNETQEFVQVPNICDDLMLTEIEDGTVTWTLGGLPVLLNGLNDQQQLLLNQLSNNESPTQELQQDIVISDLLNQCTNDNQLDDNAANENSAEIVYPLELADKAFLTDHGLFTPHSDVVNSQSTPSNDDKPEDDNVQNEMDSTGLGDEIQSSDVSSQGSFIDINGLLIPQQSVLSLNSQDLLFNLQHDPNQFGQNNKTNFVLGNAQQSRKLKSVQATTKANVSLLNGDSVVNFVQGELKSDDAKLRNASVFDSSSLIRVVNADGSDTVLNVDGVLYAKSDENGLQLAAVDEEPDSTVTSDESEEQLNIDDLATVITAYRCKKCEFTCHDRNQFFVHFKQTHIVCKPVQTSIEQVYRLSQKKRRAQRKLTRHRDDTVQTFKIFCTTGEITNILNATSEEVPEASEDNLVQPSLDLVDNTLHLPTVHECIYVSENGLLQIPLHEDASVTDQEGYQQPQPLVSAESLLCKDLTMITEPLPTDREKKIMRVKRKKKTTATLKNVYRLSPGQQQTYSFVSDLLLGDATTSPVDGNETVEREKQLIYLCSQCAEQFLTVEQCREHMISDHKLCAVEVKPTSETNETQDPDPLDGEKETREQNKKIIEKFLTQDVLKPRKIKCTKRGCPYRFARPELLARHTACHVDGVRGQFRCPECSETHSSWRLCSVHLWRCHQLDVDMFACPLCTYKGSTYVKLKHHMKIHGDERDYVCPECGRGFKQASQLRNHRVIHLDRQLQEVPKWYVQKHCDKCGKLFADSKCLKKHVQAVHSKLKPFICNVCGHSCARKAMLQMHLRQHTGEKPYACKLCLYRTGDHNSLRRHVMRHSGTRPYKCPHCTYTAIQSNSYKNHLASKHPGMGGSYSCTECPFKTVNQDTYTSHLNDHRCGLIRALNAKTEATEVTMIYDHQVNTAHSERVTQSDSTVYTVPTNTARNVILIPADQKDIDDGDDDETQNCFLSLSELAEEQTVDTGGITIPAESDHSNHM